jgi:hypothetical protein
MFKLRGQVRFNPDMPGSIEHVHPNKFMPNLRPVEEFRHTPIVPISEKELEDYKQKIAAANRKGYYVEIKKDTIYYYTIALMALGTIAYTFFVVNEKQMKIQYDLDRTKVLKRKGNAGRIGI